MANGITLRADYGPYIVTAISPTQHFYTDTDLSAAVTLPAIITTTTTWYCAPAYSAAYTFTCTQLDGSDISPGAAQWVGTTADSTLNPRPSLAQVAADTAQPAHRYRTGEYYFATDGMGSSTAALSKDHLRLSPYRVLAPVSIARLGCSVTTGGSAGAVIRLGIYADNGSGYPGSLLLDAGAGIDATSATVQEITLGTPQVLTAGLYWFGGALQVATGASVRNIVTNRTAVPVSFGTSQPTTAQEAYGYSQTGVTGALPATFGTTTTTTSVCIRMFFKVS